MRPHDIFSLALVADVTILICAAGMSARMRGADKLLERVDGTALLHRVAMAAVETGMPVIVALPVASRARMAALDGLAVAVIEVADAAKGMGASLRAGAVAVGDAVGMMVVLADMPEITGPDMARLIARFAACDGTRFVRAASSDGIPGHPVIFPRDCLAGFATLTGDAGAQTILRGNDHRTEVVPLDGQRALVDLDTPEDWAAWRASRT